MNSEQLERYARHISLSEIGLDGQEKLLRSKVLVVGVGGLGSAISIYLSAAGIGTLGIIDSDLVDLSNLQRQIIHSVSNIGTPKVDSAKERIHSINPDVHLRTYHNRLDSNNVNKMISEYDIVVDGTDNFSTRYVLNRACVELQKPFVHGSIFKFEGQLSVFKSPEGPCYQCLFPEQPPEGVIPSSIEVGIMGILPGVIGTLQATEVIKWIVGKGDCLMGRLLLYNALEMSFREVNVEKDPECFVCGQLRPKRK